MRKELPGIARNFYVLILVSVVLLFPWSAISAADFTCSWSTAANGDWDAGGNWSACSGGFPSNGASTFDATINVASTPYIVTLDTNITIDMLLLDSVDATILQTQGTFTANNGINLDAGEYQLRGGRLLNSVISQNGGTLTFGNSNNNRMDGVTINGDIVMDITSGDVRLQNGTSWTGDARLTTASSRLIFEQTGTVDNTNIFLDGASSVLGLAGSNTLTLGPSAVVNLNASGSSINSDQVLGGDSAVDNQGLIVADNSLGGGATRNIQPDTFNNAGTVRAQNGASLNIFSSTTTNTGVIEATAGTTIAVGNGNDTVTNGLGGQLSASDATLSLAGNWSNAQGTIDVLNSTLNLGGSFSTSGLGTINRTGGTVNVTGDWDNVGDSFTFDGSTGDYVLANGTITGGVLNVGTNQLLFSNSNNNRMDGVTINGDIVMDITSGDVRLQNGTSWTGDARLTTASSRLIFEQTGTVDNTNIFLDGASSVLGLAGSNTLTLGPSAVVNLNASGSSINSDQVLGGDSAVDNQGLIVADNSLGGGATRNIQPDTFNNAGTVRAQNGAILTISSVNNLSAARLEVDNGTIVIGTDQLVMPDGSLLQGTGTVTSANIDIAGRLAPGNSAGSLNLDGDVTLGPTALFDIEVGGVLAGTEYDELNVTGALVLGGVFTLSLIDGFIPDSADIFQIGAASSISGGFSNINSGDLLSAFSGFESFRLYFGAGNPFGENTLVIAGAQPVPLPPALILFSSLLPLMLRRRRKR